MKKLLLTLFVFTLTLLLISCKGKIVCELTEESSHDNAEISSKSTKSSETSYPEAESSDEASEESPNTGTVESDVESTEEPVEESSQPEENLWEKYTVVKEYRSGIGISYMIKNENSQVAFVDMYNDIIRDFAPWEFVDSDDYNIIICDKSRVVGIVDNYGNEIFPFTRYESITKRQYFSIINFKDHYNAEYSLIYKNYTEKTKLTDKMFMMSNLGYREAYWDWQYYFTKDLQNGKTVFTPYILYYDYKKDELITEIYDQDAIFDKYGDKIVKLANDFLDAFLNDNYTELKKLMYPQNYNAYMEYVSGNMTDSTMPYGESFIYAKEGEYYLPTVLTDKNVVIDYVDLKKDGRFTVGVGIYNNFPSSIDDYEPYASMNSLGIVCDGKGNFFVYSLWPET